MAKKRTRARKKPTIKTLQAAVESFKGAEATGRILDLSGRAVRKWLENGKLPESELSGRTTYAATMAEENPDIDVKALHEQIKVKDSNLAKAS